MAFFAPRAADFITQQRIDRGGQATPDTARCGIALDLRHPQDFRPPVERARPAFEVVDRRRRLVQVFLVEEQILNRD